MSFKKRAKAIKLNSIKSYIRYGGCVGYGFLELQESNKNKSFTEWLTHLKIKKIFNALKQIK